jgi:hypothetical protein
VSDRADDSTRAGQAAAPSPWARALLLAAVLVAGVGAVTGRVVWSGEAEIAASTAALERGDAREATVRARRAAGWYAPGAPHVRVAYERLTAMALAAEAHRRDDVALLAWRAIRSSSLETRWLVTPHRHDLERANREIARMTSKPTKAAAADPALEATHLQALLRQEAPRAPWLVALVVGFLLWAVGLGWWARAAADVAGRLAWTRARLPAAIALLGMVLWVVAVWRA